MGVQRSFSNKPPNGFPDFFAKIEHYVTVISGPAMELHGATPLTKRIDADAVEGSVFKYPDTLTSRAEIADLAALLANDVVAVIGLTVSLMPIASVLDTVALPEKVHTSRHDIGNTQAARR